MFLSNGYHETLIKSRNRKKKRSVKSTPVAFCVSFTHSFIIIKKKLIDKVLVRLHSKKKKNRNYNYYFLFVDEF